MAGVMSLMQPQGQQGPMPGQAPQQPMQGMMPQQGAATPAAMVGPLTQMHMQQLVQLMLNPRPEGPPLYAVISAIAEKQKTDKAMQTAQGQQVMAQNQQMQQQPPVAAQVVQAAKQTEQQNANPEQQLRQRLERAVNSGNVAEASAIMDMLKELEQSEFTDEKPKQGYAGGGAVAFAEGGRTFGYAPDYEESRRVGINLSPYDSLEVRADKLRRLEIYRRTGVVPPPREAEPPEYREPGSSPEEMGGQSVVQRPPSEIRKLLTPSLSAIANSITGERPSFYSEELYGKPKAMPMPPAINVPFGRGMGAERSNPQEPTVSQAPSNLRPSGTSFDITSPSSINALRIAAQDTSLPESERADLRRRIAMMEQQAPSRGMPSVAPSQATAPSANLSPEMEAYFRNRASDLRTRQGLPEDILAGRAGLEALARESIAAQRSEAEAFGREARERRDAALARTQRGILDDPQALLALAGSIDTRRGQGIGSLARGAAGMLGQREASAEAARKEYAAAQQTERMLQANVRQATMLEAQRAQALREGDFNRANQIKDQIDALMMQRETLLMERKDKAIEQARLERVASAQELTAAKPTELELAMARPEEYARIMRQRAEAAQSRKSPEQIRKEDLERYADNWEKLDMLQKRELATQGITNFQQYVRMRDQMAGVGGATAPAAGAAPAVGTIMQGYRFKGGNPSDKNNWEKV